MKKTTKVWLTIAGVLVLVGCIIFAGVMTMLKWDFTKLSTVKYETNVYEIAEAFCDISITTDTADVRFVPSGDGKCTVECYEAENAKHSVAVENGTLTIKINDSKPWYVYIGFCFSSPRITVYLPQAEYAALSVCASAGDVEIPKDFAFARADISLTTGNAGVYASASESIQIKTSMGNIRVENVSAGSLDLSTATGAVTVSGIDCRDDLSVAVSTGEARLTGLSCRDVISTGTTGSVILKDVIAANRFSIERSTGDVKFTRCDAAEIFVKTNTGNVTGSLLTDKVFLTDTDTGSVTVPKTATGGRCEIETDTGNIKIEID